MVTTSRIAKDKETAKEIATVCSDAIFKGRLEGEGRCRRRVRHHADDFGPAGLRGLHDPSPVPLRLMRVREGSLDGARTILAQAVLNLKASCCIVPRAMYAGIRLSGKEMRVRD